MLFGSWTNQKKVSILKGLWRSRKPKGRVMTEQMWEKVSESRWEWKVGSIWKTEQGGEEVQQWKEEKNMMERQKCGSCENVKEKCVKIKDEWRAGWNLLLQEPKAKAQLSIRTLTVSERKAFSACCLTSHRRLCFFKSTNAKVSQGGNGTGEGEIWRKLSWDQRVW